MFATAASRRATIAAWSATSRRAARPSHFAPDARLPALEIYRSSFQPSEQLQEPYAMVGANVIVADDDETARRLFTSVQQSFSNILRGRRGQLPPRIDDIESYWTRPEKERASAMLRRTSCSRNSPRDERSQQCCGRRGIRVKSMSLTNGNAPVAQAAAIAARVAALSPRST